LDGGAERVEAALGRRGGAFAGGAKMELSRGGGSELVLLEPLALGGRDKDWPSMLRSTLAPRVPGLDPVSADALGERTRACTIPGEALAKLATARPALLRTLLSLQNIGTWLQWRAQQEVPLWTRRGRMGPSLTQSKEQRWATGTEALGVSMSLAQYPSRKAALLCIHPPPGQTTSSHLFTHSLQLAFEGELCGRGDAAAQGSSPEERMRARAAAAAAARAAARVKPGPSALDGTRWCSATVDGKKAVRLAFGGSAGEPLALTLESDTVRLSMTPMGD